ncbi:acyl-CoA thioesterase [Polyangium sp. y55x31]|uniref:acyl-CoA thioesterase n=1 Tax=Polyangium sp. y55x31 TaxID=3042688 RepID=UPI002482C57C|nr:acyl-CoA thioesterase [Polyangium sp. y55x31]MDI1483532.1 acyl-CoA thioesterase [Polyangium sp. y55x31]
MTAASSEEYVFPVVASPGDIDELGHVSNVVYVRWVQDAAKAHSEAVGWDRAAYQRAGAVFVVRRHEIDYLAPVFLDDRIEVRTHVAKFGAATCERKTRLVRVSDGVEVARAVTSWAFVAITTQRPTRIPQEIRDAFPAAVVRAGV